MMKIEATITGPLPVGFPRKHKVQAVINPNDWEYSRSYLLIIGGQVTIPFLIFADSPGDALDEFVDDERFGHMIVMEDLQQLAENEAKEVQNYAGNYSKPVDLEHVYVFPCTYFWYGGDTPLSEDQLIAHNREIFRKFNEAWLENGREDDPTTEHK